MRLCCDAVNLIQEQVAACGLGPGDIDLPDLAELQDAAPRPRSLNAGQRVPITEMALWLGHQSVESTMKHPHVDPKTKEDAMEQTRPIDVPPGRDQPTDPWMDDDLAGR